jgi:hypothetical protein
MKEYITELDFNTVIDRLKQGQVLKSDITESTVEMIDGILVEKKDNYFLVFPQISNNDNFKQWYFERPQPQLEIKIGKFYITRDDKKAYVFAKNSAGKYNVAIEDGEAYAVFEGGYYSEEEETEKDLIAVWDKNRNLNGGRKSESGRFEKVKELLEKGYSRADIAKETGTTYNAINSFIYYNRKKLGL